MTNVRMSTCIVGGGPAGLMLGLLCLLKRPFLLPPLMLRPTTATLLGDDLRSDLVPVDPQRIRAIARRVAPRSARLAPSGTVKLTPTMAHVGCRGA